MSSVHYSNGNGALLRSYNWQHQHVNAITCTPPIPPHLPTHSDRFASGSTQSTNLRVPRISIPRMTLDGVIELCPGCYASPFPSVWTMDGLGCVHCELWLAHPKVAQSGSLPSPVPPLPPAMPLDQPRALNNCSFQNNSRKGKLPQSRARRSAKASSPTVQESRCCPFTSSGNITLPCLHINCSPPPDIRYLSRHGMENDKWERARKEAVASFSYENCGCTFAQSFVIPFPVIHQSTLILSLQTSDRSRLDDCRPLSAARLLLYAIYPRRAICIQP